MIGSNLVTGLNAVGIDDIDRRRRPDRRRQVPQPAGADDQRLLRPRDFYDALRARRARQGRRGVPRRRLLRHDGARRPLHDGHQLPLLEDAARRLPGAGHAAAVRVVGGDLRRLARRSARSPSSSGRSTSTATRSCCSTTSCGACCRRAQRRRSRAFATSTSTARASSTRAAWRRSRSTTSTSSATTGKVKLFGEYGGYGAGRADARLRLRRRRGRGQPVVPRAPRGERHLQPRHAAGRSRSTTSRAATVNAVRALTRRAAAGARASCVQQGLIEYIAFPEALVGKYQCFTAGRPRRGCAPPAATTRSPTSRPACARYVRLARTPTLSGSTPARRPFGGRRDADGTCTTAAHARRIHHHSGGSHVQEIRRRARWPCSPPPRSPRSTSTRPPRPSSKPIKGIGPVDLGKILDERKKGEFKDWNDLSRVKGVGERSAAKFSATA